MWTGTLSFGLVNVPVAMVSAVRDLDLHFRQLHEKDGAPVEIHRVCEKEDVEVDYEDIAHAFETDAGKHVVLTDEELASVEPRRTRTIDIEQFVDLVEIDPMLLDHPYFLVPAAEDEGSARAYALLSEVMEQTKRAAVGRFVLRAKEYLAVVRPREGVLSLSTMLFADEVRPVKDIDSGAGKAHKPTKRQLDAAVAVIEELSCDWDPDKHKDRYRDRLRRVVDRKRKGETIKAPEQAPDPDPGGDLMAALERTLTEMGVKGN